MIKKIEIHLVYNFSFKIKRSILSYISLPTLFYIFRLVALKVNEIVEYKI